MMIKHQKSVEAYVSQVMDLRAALDNLVEFVGSLPAPDEDNNIPGLNYGHLGDVGRIHELIGEAMGHANEYSEL